MATAPKIVADLTLQLTSALAVGGTTATISSNVDDDGVTLPDGRYFFTIDGNNSAKEHISCTKTGTSLSAIKTVSRQGVETAGALRAHRVGATVVMTDFATYKDYIDQATIAGISPATTTGLGGVYTTTNTASSVVVSTDDTRIPTQAENDALAGTSGTPSSSNKFVTNADTTGTGAILRETTISTVPIIRTYTSGTNTWTKPAGLKYAVVEVVGGGGAGESNNYPYIGAGGGTSSFGSHCSATGGGAGWTIYYESGTYGGVGSGGDINLEGQEGTYSKDSNGSSTTGLFSSGGYSFLMNYGRGGAGQYGSPGSGGTYKPSGHGGGYSKKIIAAASLGSTETATVGAGGTAVSGGNNGSAGVVIVTEYYV